MSHHYLIALGSNMRVSGLGPPRRVIAAAIEELADRGLRIVRVSSIITTRPIGPSQRSYANAAALIKSEHLPSQLLALLQSVEQSFGRRRSGQRWRARPLDLDIVMWSGGIWESGDLTIPHREFRRRKFVLGPASEIAPRWRDPVTGLRIEHLHTRLTGTRPLPRCRIRGRALSSVGRATDF